ncbi:MAG: hypothetical protein HYZ53_25635 [Planctomycetes bacterium]|nr:hypothetical protein [Planctomycetota bacterium]
MVARMMDANEGAWLDATRAGDGEAFYRLVDAYRPLAHAVLFRETGELAPSTARMAAIFQGLYARVTAGEVAAAELPALVRAMAREAWAAGVAPAAAEPTEKTTAGAAAGGGGPNGAEETAGETPNAGGHSVHGTEKLRAQRAVAALSGRLEPGLRAHFILRFVYRLPYRELARLLGESSSDARATLQRVHEVVSQEVSRLEKEEGLRLGLS